MGTRSSESVPTERSSPFFQIIFGIEVGDFASKEFAGEAVSNADGVNTVWVVAMPGADGAVADAASESAAKTKRGLTLVRTINIDKPHRY